MIPHGPDYIILSLSLYRLSYQIPPANWLMLSMFPYSDSKNHGPVSSLYTRSQSRLQGNMRIDYSYIGDLLFDYLGWQLGKGRVPVNQAEQDFCGLAGIA